ncbi:P2X purinoceptor 6 isoform X2 [Prinia subflava]|uniref:P2X purinoceptor 6 isoform X2 n=1 Tax=Prinia subflava TaxID=208062 RepID=UPI002FDF1242
MASTARGRGWMGYWERIVPWEGGQALAQGAQSSCGCPWIPGNAQGQAGQGLEQPEAAMAARAGLWGRSRGAGPGCGGERGQCRGRGSCGCPSLPGPLSVPCPPFPPLSALPCRGRCPYCACLSLPCPPFSAGAAVRTVPVFPSPVRPSLPVPLSAPCPSFPLVPLPPPCSPFPPRCRHAGPNLRDSARLQDCQVLADSEPAGGAAAPAAAAERAWLPAGVGTLPSRWPVPAEVGTYRQPSGPARGPSEPPAPPQVGAAAAEGVPGARRGPACCRRHQGEGGGSRRGCGPAALGRCGSHLAPAGRKCAFPGDPFHCHNPASPRHLPRGIKTGKCLMFNATHSTCEIYGWCPVENGTLPRKPLLAEAENFTIFIKNTVHFTKFNFSKCNTLQTTDPSYFKSCTYDPVFNPSCPVFRVRDMVEAAGENFGDLALLGGSIRVLIEWNCDLDHSTTQCQPQYSFSLQDTKYNFRTASYYWGSQRQLYRNLLKFYGIRFDLSVHGQAGKFSIVPTAVSFGTSIAFFGAATMVCDLVLLYLDAKADLYWKEKFEEARPPKGKPEASA